MRWPCAPRWTSGWMPRAGDRRQRKAFRLSEARYKNGIDSYLTTLVAQRTLYSAQQTLISLRLTEQSNRITLYKVLGGGWNEETAQPGAAADRAS
jgi:multidrug efflux system outer membrane protein